MISPSFLIGVIILVDMGDLMILNVILLINGKQGCIDGVSRGIDDFLP